MYLMYSSRRPCAHLWPCIDKNSGKCIRIFQFSYWSRIGLNAGFLYCRTEELAATGPRASNRSVRHLLPGRYAWVRTQRASCVIFSDGVSDPFFLESRSRALRLETLHRLFFMKFCKEFLKKTVFKNDCSKFSGSEWSVVKLSLLLWYLRDGENNLPSTPFETYAEFNIICACTDETAARNLCNERLGVRC